ncbi:hypothetical protein A9Q81_25320 [Gammaproteobacteria bacterium 42_54_T18]|nr:hypothetical protein A9Q81_25320 [Gammaproteobacteria bacterium 42_54_T18]
MKTNLSVILMAGLFFFALNSTANNITIDPNNEPIYAIKLGNDVAKIWVRSTGCTQQQHFDLVISDQSNHFSMLLTRNQKDHCRRKPKMIALIFNIDQPNNNVSSASLLYLQNPLRQWSM